MTTARTAVIVDSRPETSAQLGRLLQECGFSISWTDNGVEALVHIRHRQPTLVTVDLELSGMDGIEVIRQIRELSGAYLLAVTEQNSEEQVVLALTAGADDVISKSMPRAVLQARVQSVQRRPHRGSFDGPQLRPRLEHRGVVMDIWGRTVSVDGTEVSLALKEFVLLRLLLESGSRVRARQQLALFLSGRYANGFLAPAIAEASIDVYVCNLRRKLGGGAGRSWLETVRGAGYRLAPAAD